MGATSKLNLWAGCTAALLAVSGPTSALDPTRACSDLEAYDAGDVRITLAEAMTAGTQPSHCKVEGVIETEIRFELLLPDDWNGRFFMGGGGGFVGSIQNTAQSPLFGTTALERGYATVGTDTGHQDVGVEADWALDNEERELNFGYRAVHLTAETAKDMIRHYYGRDSEYSYFIGCSRGGGQAMVESQRFPDDFDGIVAGAPAYNWPGIGAQFLQTQQAIYPDPANLAEPVITNDNQALLQKKLLSSCDAQDGVEDGLIDDPRRCEFDPASLLCQGDAGAECLTPPQLAAVQTIYRGALRNGEPVYPGFPYGGENELTGWKTWVVGRENGIGVGRPSLHYAFGTEMFKYLIFDDPDFDYSTYDFSTFPADSARARKILDATDTDLSAFEESGGKFIWWQGWSDSAITALGTIDYYEKLEKRDPDARDFARLFLMPGVLHCSGGPGPDSADWMDAIASWVEKGEAPARVIASKRSVGGKVQMTRPLCPYPEVAIYDGSGSTDDASNFRCGRR